MLSSSNGRGATGASPKNTSQAGADNIHSSQSKKQLPRRSPKHKPLTDMSGKKTSAQDPSAFKQGDAPTDDQDKAM